MTSSDRLSSYIGDLHSGVASTFAARDDRRICRPPDLILRKSINDNIELASRLQIGKEVDNQLLVSI